jgi:hypothetical protein
MVIVMITGTSKYVHVHTIVRGINYCTGESWVYDSAKKGYKHT